jgi:glycosyltransferase involved in cell wall biosynthesis
MKVYFDARMIDHPGIGRYIRCLLPLMVEDGSLDIVLLGNREKIKKFLGAGGDVIDFDYPIYSFQEQLGFWRLKKTIGNDVLHIPHYNIPMLAKFNLVATVHDLIHIVYPEGASGRLAPAYMRFMMSRILKIAKAVICVSQSTKNEIGKRFSQKKWDSHLRGQSLFFPVIYEGIDKTFVKITDMAYLKSVKEKYSLPDKFVLYVGSIRKHKNIKVLLNAFDNFRRKNAGISMVMVGRSNQGIDIKRDGVIYLGELASDKELVAAYNLASCLFNLSLYEGFGLTILEAQKCGLPIVCSGIPVHKEIAGEGAAFVNPSYIDQIYENLYNILFNNDTRKALISNGLENVKRFDWNSTARETIEVYRKISNEGSDSSRLAVRNAGRGKDPKCFLQNISSG